MKQKKIKKTFFQPDNTTQNRKKILSKYSIFYLTFNILHTSVEKLLKTNRLHPPLPLQFSKTEGKLIKLLKVGL